jgi:hypothetical protein
LRMFEHETCRRRTLLVVGPLAPITMFAKDLVFRYPGDSRQEEQVVRIRVAGIRSYDASGPMLVLHKVPTRVVPDGQSTLGLRRKGQLSLLT